MNYQGHKLCYYIFNYVFHNIEIKVTQGFECRFESKDVCFHSPLLGLLFYFMNLPEWYKVKGYYHISPQSGGKWRDYKRIEKKLSSKEFVAKYAFYPLLHTSIEERRYKKVPNHPSRRAHSYKSIDGKFKKQVKTRPLHYANHFDALIMAYYADKLQRKYEKKLRENPELFVSVTAYRKIPVDGTEKNKGNIHFAKEVFDEIRARATEAGEVVVMAFDIKSFFSTLNHEFLYLKWCEIIGKDILPKDHLNVFNASTKFSFIYKNDLKGIGNGSPKQYDERRMAKIRNENGFRAYFNSPKEFRTSVKEGRIRIYQNNFKNERKEQIGIPQGLPISAVLANLYLIDFDRTVIEKLVEREGCFYRRYSDDIIVICLPNQMEQVNKVITSEMERQEVVISSDKTEIFKFTSEYGQTKVYKKSENQWLENHPLIYLGFEFYGSKTLIKSANLSKFYRRMIYAVKNKSKLALKIAEKQGTEPKLFKRKLYRIYRNIDLDHHSTERNYLQFKKLDTGEFRMLSNRKRKKPSGNYFSYAERASVIMDEPAIRRQVRNERKIFNQALDKHFHSKRKA